MPIIINEFEIITTPPTPAVSQETTPQGAAQAPPALRPEDIERIQRRCRQRMERIWAD